MGFARKDRISTADFLTSLTNPEEQVVKPGFEFVVPRTALEFVRLWKNSAERSKLLKDIEVYNRQYPLARDKLENYPLTHEPADLVEL